MVPFVEREMMVREEGSFSKILENTSENKHLRKVAHGCQHSGPEIGGPQSKNSMFFVIVNKHLKKWNNRHNF
ncbi:MAG: hypothetical protein LBB13_00575 [Rickettsiales bacterium]|nr:hypothetical protein [Rickettsiales bacterium]